MNTKFVQIGEKRKGRIIKNEEYDLEDFVSEVFAVYHTKPSLWKRMFGWDDLLIDISVDFNESLQRIIEERINEDTFGKKKKGRK